MVASLGGHGRPGSELDHAVLGALFSESTVGLHVLDPQLRLVRFNTAARYVKAFALEEALGRHPREWAGDFYSGNYEATLLEVLDTGVPSLDVEVRGHLSPDQPEIVLSVSCFRLEDTAGGVLGLATAVVDITERKRAAARLALLERAGGRIGTTLDIFRTAQEFADEMVPALADTVVVEVLDSVLRGEAGAAGTPLDYGALRCTSRRSAALDAERYLPSIGEALGLSAATPFALSLSDLRPRMVEHLGPETGWLVGEPVRGRRLTEAGAHSLLVLPLTARGSVIGVAHCYRSRTPHAFDEGELALAAELADRVALCLDNARLYARERSAARVLQLSLRPARVLGHGAVETAYSYCPLGAGGDWFDVIPLSGARVALVAGDTAGRGLEAAATMGEVRAAISALAVLDLSPEEVLERLHALVTRLHGERDRRPDTAVDDERRDTTCLYLVYSPVTRRCAGASAGHPPPVLALPDGTVEYAMVPSGPPLGRGLAKYGAAEFELAEDSVLLLSNTALLRAVSDDPQVQLERVGDALRPTGRPLQEICDEVLYKLTPEQMENDAVLLLARTRGLGPDQVAAWTLPNHPASAGEARTRTERALEHWGLARHAFTVTLVISELVTNAVRYSDGPIGVRLILDGSAVVCEVTDDSSTVPHLRHAEEVDEGGRGLYLTWQVSRRWGTRPETRGKTIWAEVSVSEDDD
ncbi:SpoIIE family protein phosphatase [Streptomyces aureus]|uniref:SpoIIE family protein phosphatase n=1 Tax=Streptomyces aureus TaxID=193461 RepID=UPI00068AC909|nr:SpoIIE family protein phosphatase [Streptomyces aureus]